MTYKMKCLSLVTTLAFLGAAGCESIERQTGLGTEAQTGAAVGGAAGGSKYF